MSATSAPPPGNSATIVDWHRLFGLTLMEVFAGSPFEVELEKELSLKRQRLDVVILRRQSGQFSGRLPDGLDDLGTHNLLSYKSLRQPLDDWTLDELVGHYVNYRKQVSPSLDALLPRDEFRLYGVSTRFPQGLGSQVNLRRLQPGVYEVAWGARPIRVLVLSDMPEGAQNAVWDLFSGVPTKVTSAVTSQWRKPSDMGTIFDQLLERYELEGITVPYTMDDFRRDYATELLNRMKPEDRLRGLAPADRLQGLAPADRLRGLSAKQIESYLTKLKKEQGRGAGEGKQRNKQRKPK